MDTKVAELFNNVLVLPDNLPEAAAIAFTPIEKRYLWFSRLRYVIGIILPLPFLLLSEMELWANTLVVGGYLALLAFNFFVHWKSFLRKGYAIRTHDISYRTGWLFRSLTVVPFNRVQHCEVESGPLERLFQLSTLKVFTAGGSGSDITIPGLNPETAKILRAHIISTAAAHEEH